MKKTKDKVTAEGVAKHLGYDSESENIAVAYLDLGISSREDERGVAQEIEESYAGKFYSDEDFVRNLLEDCCGIPKDLPPYVHIDWERTAHDVMMDYSEENCYYFRNL